jgi:lactoylglutathione lyase
MTDSPVVNHVGLCTADAARAQRFYTELLGFTVERELRPADDATGTLLAIDAPVGLHAVYLRLGEFTLELLEFERPGNPEWRERVFNDPGLTHLSLSVPDVEAVAARVDDYGGSVFSRAGIAVVVRDPDGQLVELLPMSYHARVRGETGG